MKHIILVLSLLISAGSKAQTNVAASVGSLSYDGRKFFSGTVAQIAANPRIIVNNDSCRVKSFFVSFKPDKTTDLLGPFEVSGDRLTEQNLESLQKFGGMSGILFIDELKVFDPAGRVRSLNTIVVKYKQ